MTEHWRNRYRERPIGMGGWYLLIALVFFLAGGVIALAI